MRINLARYGTIIVGAGLGLAACSPRTSAPAPRPEATGGELPLPPAATFELATVGLPGEGNFKCDPALGDVNGDGWLDLAAHQRRGDGAHVWLGDGTGQWADASAGLDLEAAPCGGGVELGHVDADGHLDLVVADHCQGVFVFLGDGAGGWEMAASGLYAAGAVPEGASPDRYRGAEDVALGDVNGDGWVDLIAGAADSGGIAVFLGDGTGRNWTEHISGLGSSAWVTRVTLADVNRDGKLDLIASCHNGPRVWLGDGHGGWQPASDGLPTPTFGGLYYQLAIGDVNEDGRDDLAVANWIDGPEVYWQQEDGSWRQSPDVFPDMLGGAFGLALGDIDRDGHLDLIVSGRLTRAVGYVYGVFFLKGDGRGGWTYVADSGLPESGLPFTWGVALADIDGDDVLDVAAASGGTVASNPDYPEPVIPAGVLTWLTRLPER